jgi:hypothetical protein
MELGLRKEKYDSGMPIQIFGESSGSVTVYGEYWRKGSQFGRWTSGRQDENG